MYIKHKKNGFELKNPLVLDNMVETFKNFVKEKVMIICRGIPGSGKSSLAKQLAGSTGVVLETDDFFMKQGKYEFEEDKKIEAHKWNEARCFNSMDNGVSPIVISNTNIKAKEAEPYVRMAIDHGYKIKVEEPTWFKSLRDPTTGKWNYDMIKGKNVHNVPENIVKKMIDEYENKDVFIQNLKKLIVK